MAKSINLNCGCYYELYYSFCIWGANSTTPKILKVQENSAYSLAGGKDGDIILAVDNKKTKTWDRAQVLLTLDNKKEYYEIKVRHEDNTEETLKVKPQESVDEEGIRLRYLAYLLLVRNLMV